MAAALFDVDIEDVNPILDLVTFSDVKDILATTTSVRAIFDLGSDFRPYSYDWVGVFYAGWGSTNEYIAYKFAPMLPKFLKTRLRRRRSVIFPLCDFLDVNDTSAKYQFLYVTRDGHVVGVSRMFQLQCCPGYDDDLCFDVLEESCTPSMVHPGYDTDLCFDVLEKSYSFEVIGNYEPRRKRSLEDTFELVSEYDESIEPRRKRSVKERIRIVSRDHDSLVNVPSSLEHINFTDVLKVVKMYEETKSPVENEEKSVVPFVPAIKPLYDVSAENKREFIVKKEKSSDPMFKMEVLCLPFDLRLPIMPGPEGVLQSIEENSQKCGACAMGKLILRDTIKTCKTSSTIIENLELEKKQLKEKARENELRLKLQSATDACRVSQDNLEQLEMIQTRNQSLENKLSHLENTVNRLLKEKRDRQESQEFQLYNMLNDGYRGLADIGGKTIRITDVSDDDDESSFNHNNGWKTKYPRKIYQLRKTIVRQSSTITCLTGRIANQKEAMCQKADKLRGMRESLQTANEDNKKLNSKLTELTERIRCLLRKRASDKTNEWRQLVRKVICDDKSTQSSEPQTKKISCAKFESSEPAPKKNYSAKFETYNKDSIRSEPTLMKRKKKRSCERVCPTCSLVFSPHVDPRVVEEHITFHSRYRDHHQKAE